MRKHYWAKLIHKKSFKSNKIQAEIKEERMFTTLDENREESNSADAEITLQTINSNKYISFHIEKYLYQTKSNNVVWYPEILFVDQPIIEAILCSCFMLIKIKLGTWNHSVLYLITKKRKKMHILVISGRNVILFFWIIYLLS